LSGLSLNFPDELVRAIATETARLVKEDGLAFSPWLNVDEAADYLSIPVGRLRNLTAAKEIRYSPQGKGYIYHREWLDEYARRAADGH
jgi:excisionase family DNA binding protein